MEINYVQEYLTLLSVGNYLDAAEEMYTSPASLARHIKKLEEDLAMKRIQGMSSKYDGIWNGHHDFRALGMPLDNDCLENIIRILEDLMKGNASFCECPSFWGQPMPLSKTHIGAESNHPYAHKQTAFLRKGRNFLRIDRNYS